MSDPTPSPSGPVDKVLLAEPRGFCAGVEMAIKALAWLVRAFEGPVFCYHEIVHHKLVVRRFEAQGVVFVDDIADVPPGSPIMLSAHGSAPEVVEAARTRGSYVVDSVCPLVTKVHHEVKVRAGKGFRIVYVGHEGHEEALGTMAVAPDAIDRVETVDDVAALFAGELFECPRVGRVGRADHDDLVASVGQLHQGGLPVGGREAQVAAAGCPHVGEPFLHPNGDTLPVAVRQGGLGEQRHRLFRRLQPVDLRDRFDPIDRIGSDGHGADRLLVAVVADVDDPVALAGADLDLVVHLGDERAHGIDHV